MLTIDQIREKIDFEIIVDAYDDDEISMGWYYTFLDDLVFPFEATAKFKKRDGSTELKKVTISGFAASESDFKGTDFNLEMVDGDYIKPISYSLLSEIEAPDVNLGLFQCWDYWVSKN